MGSHLWIGPMDGVRLLVSPIRHSGVIEVRKQGRCVLGQLCHIAMQPVQCEPSTWNAARRRVANAGKGNGQRSDRQILFLAGLRLRHRLGSQICAWSVCRTLHPAGVRCGAVLLAVHGAETLIGGWARALQAGTQQTSWSLEVEALGLEPWRYMRAMSRWVQLLLKEWKARVTHAVCQGGDTPVMAPAMAAFESRTCLRLELTVLTGQVSAAQLLHQEC